MIGKTMLLCGIVNELKSTAKSDLLSYFFCQATNSYINNATAVLRGLVYLLVDQHPSLISHVWKKYDHAGKTLFKDDNAWIALCEIFANILQDPHLNTTYLIIDALDECVMTDLPKLLSFIVRMSSVSSRVKWIVSSRNWPSIEQDLEAVTQKTRLCLELNEKSVSAAIATYIQFKVDWLSKRNKYSSDTRNAVQRYLSLNAKGTFLWVALVCQELFNIPGWKAKQKLTSFPPELNSLYKRMMDQIRNSEDADLCNRILAVVSAVYRPLTLNELMSFIEMPGGVFSEYEALSEIIKLCGSFLTLRKQTVSFIHQSAKDFLVDKAHNEIYPFGIESAHYVIFSKSLEVMFKTLRQDVYGLDAPGFSIDQVKRPDPDPLSSIRYSCVYWINHLLDCDPIKNATNDLQDGGSVYEFLRQSYLYWLEALSLCRSMSEGVHTITALQLIISVSVSSI
jgi:NACHT domain